MSSEATSRQCIELNFKKDDDHTWLNSKEASSYLGVSYGALKNMIYKRQLPFYKFGKRLRFKQSELGALLESGKVTVGSF